MSFVVGDYRAIELIGAGGSAQVWRGVAVRTGAPVALKVFAPKQVSAARREAALAAGVDHPHVVRVLDVVADDERAVLVTEWAAGGDLADLLERRGRLSAGETLTVLLPLAAALATAHERQIVHGDLSAQNVLFDRAGRPLLADLGAGRAAAEQGLPVAVTPPDAAPELARGGNTSAATDMFSLGSLALACLTGRHAWPADDLRDVMIQAAAGLWPDPADTDGPPLLISAIRGLLEHDAERRPGATSLVMDLRAAGRPEPVDLRLGEAHSGLRSVTTGDQRPLLIGRDRVGGEPSGPVVGRHGRPAEPAERAPAPARHADRLDLGRVGRSRAVTRVRPDAVAAPDRDPAPASRLWRFRSFTRPRARSAAPPSDGRRPSVRGPSRRSRALRVIALAVATLVVAGLAGAGGLWWARSGRTDPVALDRASSPAPAPPSFPTSAVVRSTGTSSVSKATPTTGTSPARVDGTTRAITTSAGSTAAQSDSRTGASSRTTAPTNAATDFTLTVRALDDARAKALVSRDAALLDAVYTSDSAARSADAAMIASLISGNLRLSGAEHLVRSTRVLGSAPLRIEVDDSLPSYLVLDAGGAVVGSTAARTAAARVLVLVKTPVGYRISAVRTA